MITLLDGSEYRLTVKGKSERMILKSVPEPN